MTERKSFRVLDVGCGEGSVIDNLLIRTDAKRKGNLEYHGVDLFDEQGLVMPKRKREERKTKIEENEGKCIFTKARLNFREPDELGKHLLHIAGGKVDEIHFHMPLERDYTPEVLQALTHLLKRGGRLYHIMDYKTMEKLTEIKQPLLQLSDEKSQAKIDAMFTRNKQRVTKVLKKSGLKLDRYGMAYTTKPQWSGGPFTANPITRESLQWKLDRQHNTLNEQTRQLVWQHTGDSYAALHFLIAKKM